MNNEFKKTSSKDQTVYTLESATSGGTSSGSIASVSTPLGGMQRRNPPGDNILAQEADKKKIPSSTPRNFVAKNAKTGGAGAHKDKKKDQKQGTAKHKKPYMEALQTQLDQLKSKVAEAIPSGNEYEQRQKLIKYIARQKDWDASDLEHSTTPELIQLYKECQADRKDWNNRRSDWWDRADAHAKEKGISKLDALGQTPHNLDRDTAQGQLKFKEQGVAEGFNGEYDDEAGMAHSNLLTSARAVMGLLKTIENKDNLPEWAQEKIAKAEMMLVSVWDYLQSQKEQGIDPKVEGYGRYDRRDAYQRDYDHSVAGMDRGNNHRDDERHDLDPSDWYIVKDGKMFKVSVYPNQEQEAISRGYSRTRDEAKAKASEQGVAEGVSDLGYDAQSLITKLRRDVEEKRLQPTPQAVLAAARELAGDMEFAPQLLVKQVLGKGVAEGDEYFNMLERSVSQAQHNLMVGVAHNPAFAQKVKVKQQVGQEFAKADVGRDISKLPVRVPKKK